MKYTITLAYEGKQYTFQDTFCQLWGTMMDVPRFIPHSMIDIQQTLDERGITDDLLPQQQEGVHHALSDARYIKRLWEWLQGKSNG